MSWRTALRLAGAAACLVAALLLVHDRGVPGREEAPARAARALASLHFEPVGEAEVQVEVDQAMAWALERSGSGGAGAALARGEGGAIRYRVRWSGGGEASVTADGTIWGVRRPVPTDPGPDLFPAAAAEVAAAALPPLVAGADAFSVRRAESVREEEHLWHRLRWAGGPGPLPLGWEREVEVEVVGSTVVSFSRRVRPYGTDLGVVAGRTAELRRLRGVAAVALGLVVVGILLGGAEGIAFHERLALGRGGAVGVVVAFLDVAQGGGVGPAVLLGAVTAAAVAVMPLWTSLPPSRWLRGVPVGVATAVLVTLAPPLLFRLGGFMPEGPAVAVADRPWELAAGAWRTAIAEEPLLRGALLGLATPLLGFWGSSLVGVFVGSLLHPVPGVPLQATVAVAGLLQLGMVAAARVGGVGAAVVARGVCEALLLRSAYPLGLGWSLVAIVPVGLGLAVGVWWRGK